MRSTAIARHRRKYPLLDIKTYPDGGLWRAIAVLPLDHSGVVDGVVAPIWGYGNATGYSKEEAIDKAVRQIEENAR